MLYFLSRNVFLDFFEKEKVKVWKIIIYGRVHNF